MDLREKREANRCAIDEFNRVKRAKLDRELSKPLPSVADPKADKKRDRERANRASAAASRAKLIFYSKELERRTDRLEMERNAESERANRVSKKLTALRDEVCTLRKVLRELWDLKDQKVCAYLIDSDALFLLSRRRDEEDATEGIDSADGDGQLLTVSADGNGRGEGGDRNTVAIDVRAEASQKDERAHTEGNGFFERNYDDEGASSADSEDGTKSGIVSGRPGQNEESLPRGLSPSAESSHPMPPSFLSCVQIRTSSKPRNNPQQQQLEHAKQNSIRVQHLPQRHRKHGEQPHQEERKHAGESQQLPGQLPHLQHQLKTFPRLSAQGLSHVHSKPQAQVQMQAQLAEPKPKSPLQSQAQSHHLSRHPSELQPQVKPNQTPKSSLRPSSQPAPQENYEGQVRLVQQGHQNQQQPQQQPQRPQQNHIASQSPRPSSTLHSLLHPPQDTQWFNTRTSGSLQQQRTARRCVDGATMTDGPVRRLGRSEIDIRGQMGVQRTVRNGDWWSVRGTHGE